MSTTPTTTVSLPKVWFEDAENRGLTDGLRVERRGGRLVRVVATREQLVELLSDARLYADGSHLAPECKWPCASARAAVPRLERALSGKAWWTI